MTPTLNILIVEDNPADAELLVRELRRAGIEPVWQRVETESDYLARLHDRIDLVISDLRMPGGLDGLTLMTRIKERHPAVKLLVVSMSDELEIVNRLFVAEVDGYILKNSGKDELLAAIDDVLDDRVHFEQGLLTRILARQRELANGTIAPQKPMSEREREVLELIMQEHTSKQIAEKLFISKQTVDSHRLRIMEKTGARTLVGLIKYAVANGML